MTGLLDMPDPASGTFPYGGFAAELRHAGDAARVLHGVDRRWTEALISETRAHLSGCLNAVELAMGVELDGGWLSAPLAALGIGYARLAIEGRAELLSPLLLDHLRQRASAALALRLTLRPVSDPEIEPPATVPASGPVSDALIGLRFSTNPWLAPHPLDRPMRADLPAEPFCDLVWTGAALLIDGLSRRMGIDPAAASASIANAAATIIARHDEQAGPFARAAYVAALIHDPQERRSLGDEAAMRHDLLLLAALCGQAAGITVERSLALLLDGAPTDRAALARALGLGESAFVALLDTLAPFGVEGDETLPDRLAHYRALSVESAADRLKRWRGPAPLIDKLARIAWGSA